MAFLLRLAALGSRNSLGRLAGIALGVGLGMAMFLLMLGGYVALDVRDARDAWMGAAYAEGTADVGVAGAPVEAGTVLVARGQDAFHGRPVDWLLLAPGPDAPEIPGVTALPAPGSSVVSPGLAKLIAATPPDQLGDRYGTIVGTIDVEALGSPDALIALVGTTPDAVRARPGAASVSTFAVPPPSDAVPYQIVVAIGAIGLFFPVLLLIAIVTRLGAVARIERFSTLRLLGASPRQVAMVAAIETVATSAVGSIIGVVVAMVLRPLAARIPLNGGAFHPADLAVGPWVTLAAVAVMILAAAGASAFGIARTGISPLGASRAFRERTPRVWRLAPLLAGAGMLATVATVGLDLDVGLLIFLLVGGFGITALGIVLAGPWITYRLSAFLTRHARSAPALIAVSRIRAHPVATFRSVSGIVIAVFMVSVFTAAAGGVLSTMRTDDSPGALPGDGIIAAIPAEADLAAVVAAAGAVLGVSDIVIGFSVDARALGLRPGSIAYATEDFATLGIDNPPDAPFGAFSRDDYLAPQLGEPMEIIAITDPALVLAPAALVLRTDGKEATIEQARTALVATAGLSSSPMTRTEFAEIGTRRLLRELAIVAYIGAFVSIAIAGCSLSIATASGMIDRRRVLGLLRLIGMPVSNLHRIVGFEAAVPLVGVLALSVLAGYGVAWTIVENLSTDIHIGWPEPMYFVTLALGLLLALGSVAATVGTIRRNTAISATRFE